MNSSHEMIPVRVLFLLGDLEMGGAQRVVLTVLRRLHGERIDPHLALVRGHGPLEREIPEGLPVHRLKSRRVRYAFFAVVRLCWSLRPDVVVSTVGHVNLLLLLLKPLLPSTTVLVVREANTPSIRLRHTRCPRLYRLSYRALYPLCDRVICNCEYMKNDMVAHFSLQPDWIRVIPNPVDIERIHALIDAESNPYSGEEIQIVSLGRLHYQKGFDLLLKAYHRCRSRIPNTHLTIVGDGPEKDALQGLARDCGISEAVSFVGQKKNPFPYIAHADFLVSSSRWEGSPNTVLESLGCGTPVLAFDCPGGTAEIIREGENGWLAPPEDWQSLAERVVRIVEARAWSGLKGKNLVPEGHLCENVVSRWEEMLRCP